MTKKIHVYYFLFAIAVFVLSVLSLLATVSVSYAKWDGTNSSVSANTGTGEWTDEEGPLPEYTYGAVFEVNGKKHSVDIEELLFVPDDGAKWFVVRTVKGAEKTVIALSFENRVFSDLDQGWGDMFSASLDTAGNTLTIVDKDERSEGAEHYFGDDVYLIAFEGSTLVVHYLSTSEVVYDKVLDMNAFVG